MKAAELARVISSNASILCLNTCTLLDLMRDPTRRDMRVEDRKVATDLLGHAEAGGLIVLMAEQVRVEFVSLDYDVRNGTLDAIKGLKALVGRVEALAAVYGSSGVADLSHLDDHVAEARTFVGRWLDVSIQAPQEHGVTDKALARMNQARAPARRGRIPSRIAS